MKNQQFLEQTLDFLEEKKLTLDMSIFGIYHGPDLDTYYPPRLTDIRADLIGWLYILENAKVLDGLGWQRYFSWKRFSQDRYLLFPRMSAMFLGGTTGLVMETFDIRRSEAYALFSISADRGLEGWSRSNFYGKEQENITVSDVRRAVTLLAAGERLGEQL